MKVQISFLVLLFLAFTSVVLAGPSQHKKGTVRRPPAYPGTDVPEVRCRLEPYQEAVTNIENRDKQYCNTVTVMNTEDYDCSTTEWTKDCPTHKKLRSLGKGKSKTVEYKRAASCQVVVPKTCQKKVPSKKQECHTKTIQVPVKGTETRYRRVCPEPPRSKKGH